MTVRVMKPFIFAALCSAVAISAAAQYPEAISDKQSRAEKIEMKIQERFQKTDTDKNGIISHDEMIAGASEKFQEFDQNNDGYIELSELPKEMSVPDHRRERIEKRLQKRQEHAEARGESFEAKRLIRQPTRLKFVARMDQDNDERLSLEEFAAPAIKRFKHSDMNGDGEVTIEEAKQSVEQKMRKRFRGKMKARQMLEHSDRPRC